MRTNLQLGQILSCASPYEDWSFHAYNNIWPQSCSAIGVFLASPPRSLTASE